MAKPPKPVISSQRAGPLIPEDFDKNAWLKEMKSLAKDANIEERDRFRPLLKIKNETKEVLEELEKLEKKYEITLMRERDQLRQFGTTQKKELDTAKVMIKQSVKNPEYLERVQTKCQQIEQNIKNFKLKSKATYQNLVEEEKALQVELAAYEEKFESWVKDTTVSSDKPSIQNKARSTSISERLFKPQKLEASDQDVESLQIKKQMDQVDKQIREIGGLECGWDAADHKDFLRIWTKHQGRQVIAFNQEVQRAVPTMDNDQIAEHVSTYKKYLELLSQKKDLIAQYKEAKDRSKKQRLQEAEQQSNKMKSIDRSLGLVKQSRTDSAARASSKEIQNDLQDWRKKKLERQMKERDDQLLLEQAEKRKFSKKLEKDREEKRELIEEFKFQKEMQKQRDKQLEDMERRRTSNVVTKEQQERIHKREQELQAKRTQLITQKEELTQVKDVLEIGSDLYKGKVESKLLKQTAAVELKKREKFDPKKESGKDPLTMGGRLPTMGGGTASTQLRVVPSWRQGV